MIAVAWHFRADRRLSLYPGGATRESDWCARRRASAMKPSAFSSSTRSRRNWTVSGPSVHRRAHRLADLHEPALDQPEFGMCSDVLGQRLTDTGRDLEVLGAERVDSLLTAHDARVLQRAGEEEVVGGPALHADAYARPVDVGDRGEVRATGHGVHALDHDVRRGEGDFGLPCGLDGQEAQVGAARLQGLVRLPCRVEADELHRHVQPSTDLARDVDGHAGRCGRGALGQYRIAQIDRRPQHALGRQVFDEGGRRDRHGRSLGHASWRLGNASGPGTHVLNECRGLSHSRME